MTDENRISERAARLLHTDGLEPPVSPTRIVEDSESEWGWPFINLTALGKNSGWRYAAGIACIILYPLGFSVLVVVFTKGRHLPPLPMLLAMLGSIIVAGLAAAQTVTLTHKRPLLSVVSATITMDWRRLCIGTGIEACLVCVMMLVEQGNSGWPWQSTASPSVLIAAFLLIPAQAASEEIVFRGYLTQALGRIFKSRAKIVFAVGVLFALAHWNAYGPLTMPYIFIVSVTLSLVSLRDNRLELAIGAHTANNWMGIGTINSLINGEHDTQVTWLSLVLIIPAGILLYALTRFAVADLSKAIKLEHP